MKGLLKVLLLMKALLKELLLKVPNMFYVRRTMVITLHYHNLHQTKVLGGCAGQWQKPLKLQNLCQLSVLVDNFSQTGRKIILQELLRQAL